MATAITNSRKVRFQMYLYCVVVFDNFIIVFVVIATAFAVVVSFVFVVFDAAATAFAVCRGDDVTFIVLVFVIVVAAAVVAVAVADVAVAKAKTTHLCSKITEKSRVVSAFRREG